MVNIDERSKDLHGDSCDPRLLPVLSGHSTAGRSEQDGTGCLPASKNFHCQFLGR